MIRIAINCLALSIAIASQGAQVTCGPGGVTLRFAGPGAPLNVVFGYEAHDDAGLAFRTAAASPDGKGGYTFALEGPVSENASVTVTLESRGQGLRVLGHVRHSGPARKWNPWTSGWRLEYSQPIHSADTRPVTRWIRPTGEHPWEVPGDTLYPDTECQVRRVSFGDPGGAATGCLVMVSPQYDPDWIYGNNSQRAGSVRMSPAGEAPAECWLDLCFFSAAPGDIEAPVWAARAAGRPVAVWLETGHTGNLFAPGERVPVTCEVANVTQASRDCTLRLQVHDYAGRELLNETQSLSLQPEERRKITHDLPADVRGVWFVDAVASWDGGSEPVRTTVGILPERTATGTAAESPFGMAALIAAPERYPDQYPAETVLSMMQRIGVRWVRGGWFPFKDRISAEEERQVRQDIDLLARHGILPHVQLGSGLPKPEELHAFRARLEASLSRFAWVSDYVEIGNELNHAGVSGDQYVEGMLKPVHEVMRRVHPDGKIMCMGLGGVTRKWLGEFVQAGGMELIDVLSVHPGCHPRAPEYWEGWHGWVFRPQMLDAMKAAREAGGKEVWITESYAPTPPGRSQVDLRTSADYLVRNYICSLGIGVRVNEWYQFQDGVWFAQRPNPDDIEYNFGIVYTDLTPKPAYVAYGTMTQQLEGARYVGRLDLGADDLYAARFERKGETVDVLWSYREKHETDLPWWPPENYKDASRKPAEPWVERWREPVEVTLPALRTVTVTDIMGNSRDVDPTDGRVVLGLTGSPIYVRGVGEMPVLDAFWQEIP